MKKLFLALFIAFASVSIVSHETFATVLEDNASDVYTGNGSTTAFTYNFRLLDQTHIKVTVDGVTKTLSTHYTVSGVGNSTGGTVTFLVAPADATKVVLLRNGPLAQPTNYVANSAYSASTVMANLDRLTALAQQLQEQITRAYKMAEGYGLTALPNECSGTEKMIGFDATGAISCSTDLNAAAASANQWDQITAPTGNASLAMGNNRSTFTWGAATGANAPWRLTDTASNSGTAVLFQLDTASGSSLKPFQATAAGTSNGVQMSTAGSLAAIGTGDIKATSLDIPTANKVATFNAIDPLTTKGDLLTNNGTDSIRFPVCANGVSPVGDSTTASGWACGTPDVAQTVLVMKAADETVNNSAALQDDDELLCAVAANKRYLVEAFISLSAANATADFKVGWTVPAAAAMLWGPHATLSGTSNPARYWAPSSTGSSPTALLTAAGSYSFGSAAVTGGVTFMGLASTAGTSGNIQLQWAQNTANVSDSKFLTGSVLRCTLLN